MEPFTKIFGAKASIHIKYGGDLTSLAAILAAGLMLADFEVSQRETPPYDILASAESLGWQLWLESNDSMNSFQYSLRMETEHCLDELFKDQMHDLSPWFARFVSLVCDSEVLVAGTQLAFSHGKSFQLRGR